jgi:squalene-hopene/tetraprenyl-beta-curcumene cyclase
MVRWVAVCLAIAPLAALSADWSPRLAADYMDARQKEWFAWPPANTSAKPCVSCHTGMSYLMARPALRKALGESQPTIYETGLRDSLAARLDKSDPASVSNSVESVMAALFLPTSGPHSKPALDRMWSLQLRDGAHAGSWKWFSLDDDPWEEPESTLFGASLAALAAASVPVEDHGRRAALVAYLKASHEQQPLQNRLMILWAATRLPEVMDDAARRELIAEILSRQRPDGGWDSVSLGPWRAHPQAPSSAGTDAYATALVAFVLERAGVKRANPSLARALDWLRSHQEKDGSWAAVSMNKRYPENSQQFYFMRDAATGFAVLALLYADGMSH